MSKRIHAATMYRILVDDLPLKQRIGNRAAGVVKWTRVVARFPLKHVELVSDGEHGMLVIRSNRKGGSK